MIGGVCRDAGQIQYMITIQEWKQKKDPKNENINEGSEEYKKIQNNAFVKTDKKKNLEKGVF